MKMAAGAPRLRIESLTKTFVLHNQGGVRLPVLHGIDLEVRDGEGVALSGPSGAGKSTLLRCVYGAYCASAGAIRIRHASGETDIASATPRTVLALRRHVVGYVSQFLRVIPRVSALDLVAEPLAEHFVDAGQAPEEAAREARRQAAHWLLRLRIPMRLWNLPPATFSGGEQQRVNIARGLIRPRPLLLLDEPTASLDAANRATVVAIINEARAAGAAVVGIFHDARVREAVATRVIEIGTSA